MLLLQAALAGVLSLTLALIGSIALERRAAALRRSIWVSAFAALAASSAVALLPIGPRLYLRSAEAPIDAPLAFAPEPEKSVEGGPGGARDFGSASITTASILETHTGAGPTSAGGIALFIWALVALGLAMRVPFAERRANDLRRGATAVSEADALVLFKEWSTRIGVKAELLEHRELSVPTTVGLLHAAVILPSPVWRSWTRTRLSAVIVHELYHAKVRDCAIELSARLACALHWFNPLAWIGLARLRTEREHAADDFVLEHGARASSYARDLLDVASQLAANAHIPGTAMAKNRSDLERRIADLVSSDRARKCSRTSVRIVAASSLSCALAFGCVSLEEHDRAGTFTAKTSEIIAKRAKNALRGDRESAMVIGVIRGDQRMVLGFGHVGPNDPRSPDGRTVFGVGSITELFTGLAFAREVADERVSLDQPARSLIHELPDLMNSTLLDLAVHRSGLPALPANFVEQDRSTTVPSYTHEMLNAYLRVATPSRSGPATPENELRYSYLGVGLLGRALAAREGTTYRELIASRVLGPLGLERTDFFAGSARWSHDLAVGRNVDGASIEHARFDEPELGACCAMRSTADDLLALLRANLSPAESPFPSAIALTHEPHTRYSPRERIGIGWHILEPSGLLFKRGGGTGFKSFVGIDRARGIGVVVLAAAESVEAESLAAEILRALTSDEQHKKTAANIPPDAMISGAMLGGDIELIGSRVSTSSVRAGGMVGLTLYYRARAAIDRDLRVLVHADPASPMGGPRVNGDHYPAHGAYPTDRWQAGEIIEDHVELPIPADHPGGPLALWTGLYDAAGRLPVTGLEHDHDRVRGPTIVVEALHTR